MICTHLEDPFHSICVHTFLHSHFMQIRFTKFYASNTVAYCVPEGNDPHDGDSGSIDHNGGTTGLDWPPPSPPPVPPSPPPHPSPPSPPPPSPPPPPPPPTAASALAVIKQELGNPASLSSWQPGGDPCSGTWVGVTCGANGTVTGLDLSSIPGLGGNTGSNGGSNYPLPDAVQYLASSLQALDLGNGVYAGSIPASWSTLSLLTSLQLPNDPGLTGGLPPAWSVLTQLSALDLGNDPGLGGALPSAWSTLTQLTYLNVSGDGLSGPLPPGYSALLALQVLDVSIHIPSVTGS